MSIIAPPPGPASPDAPLDRSLPGAAWWRYERPAVAGSRPPATPPPVVGGPQSNGHTPAPTPTPAKKSFTQEPTGRPAGLLGIGLLVANVIGTRAFGADNLGVVLIPAAGIAFAMAFGRRCLRLRPDESWLPRLLLLGTVTKLIGSYVRYITLTASYDGVGDATRYDIEGRKLVAAWTGQRTAPVLSDLRGTNFMKWITGVVYYLFGQNLLAGFLLFGLVALVGSYYWYRALNGARFANKRLFLMFMMFAPSIVFWPSSLGKEALMQFGIGALAWATALMFKGRLIGALPLIASGGWIIWVVRPHLLALIAIAGAIAYFFGTLGRAQGSFFARPLGMVAMVVMVAVAVTAGAQFLGIEDLSVDSIQAQLDQETALTSKGGSSFSHGGNSLNPLRLPMGIVTVLFRPLPWEARSPFQMLAALESAVLIVLIFRRFESVKLAFRRCRDDPILLYSFVLLVLYSMTFSAFANFGLLTRQRSLVLPALYVLISLEASLFTKDGRDDAVTPRPLTRR